jgi:uncharacterized protein DUF2585
MLPRRADDRLRVGARTKAGVQQRALRERAAGGYAAHMDAETRDDERPAQDRPRRPFWHYALVAAGIVLVTAVILLMMGRVPISKSGHIQLWAARVDSSENSQQIADWYSFSHVIHGIAFYALFRLAGRFVRRGGWPVGLCLVLAVALEASWEVFENTPFTIERYRKATIALDYYGDSVLNSVCDILCCVLGFFLAAKLPAWASVAVVVALEAFVGYCIRDNLTLNILMLIKPIESIKRWQHGG